MGEPKAILGRALDPPLLDDIERTILVLKEVNKCSWLFSLTAQCRASSNASIFNIVGIHSYSYGRIRVDDLCTLYLLLLIL